MLSRILARLQLYGGSFSLDIPFYRTTRAESCKILSASPPVCRKSPLLLTAQVFAGREFVECESPGDSLSQASCVVYRATRFRPYGVPACY